MLEFLQDNWRLILEGFLVVISFVFCLIRKKPVKIVDFVKAFICNVLPDFINKAEVSDLKGSDKKKLVLSLLNSFAKKNGFNLSRDDIDFASEQIEYILSTPQKKG